jgi:hypothetical protein
MYEQVIFYNHFGNGDIFESREFVRRWMRDLPSKKYFYSHGKSPRILLDIPELEFKDITIHMHPMQDIMDDGNGNLYINTWIGRDGKYVLPGIGCTVEKLFDMHNDMRSKLDIPKMDEPIVEFIPDIDYSVFSIDECNSFLSIHEEPKIYIDNGIVQSKQAENFPMSDIIKEVAKLHRDKCFIVTHDIGEHIDNVYTTNSITKVPNFDLPEISYISTFCDVLIGRNSGPHVFSQVRKNVMNSNKKLLSFTYHQQGASFVVNTDVNIKKTWSSETSFDKVLSTIERVLSE